MNSFDMIFLSHTSIFSYSSKNMYCKPFLELIVGMVGDRKVMSKEFVITLIPALVMLGFAIFGASVVIP